MRRHTWSIRTVLALAIGLLVVIIFLLEARDIGTEWHKEQRIRSLQEATLLSDRIFDATETISIERDLAFSILFTSDKTILADFTMRLQKNREKVDQIFAASMQELKNYQFDNLAADLSKVETQFIELQKLRGDIDAALTLPPEKRDLALPRRWFDAATAVITGMQQVWMDFSGHYIDIDPAMSMQMRFKYILGLITEYTGRQRSLIGRLLAENVDPTPAEQADLLRWAGSTDTVWQISGTLAVEGGLTPAITPYLEDAKSHYSTLGDMVHGIFYVPGAHARPYPINVDFWLDLATQANDSLYALKDAALDQSRAYVAKLEAQARQSIFYHAAFLLLTLGLCFYTLWVILFRVIKPINVMANALVDATAGKSVSAPIAMDERGDEIGKLAQALHILQQNVVALERSNSELNEFAHIASHDLKEPLRGLHRHAEFLIEDNKGKLGQESIRRLGRVKYLSERLERLTGDLLYYSRLGNQELAVRPADLNAVIAGIRKALDIFLVERGAHIEIPQPLPVVTCDATRVTEVFQNLITNAVKYNGAREKIVEIGFVDKKAMPNGAMRHDVYFVKDNGRGIAPEFHNEIFRIFKRLPNETDTKEEGTGVGLTFVKKIIERHGGAIWLESEQGKGTVFYFTLKG